MQKALRNICGFALVATLAGAASLAQAEQAWARVISATPVHDTTGTTSYNVTYEYGGRQYTTRTDTRPGSSIAIDVGGYGVATTSPVAPQAQLTPYPASPQAQGQFQSQGQGQNWDNVVPEPGVVVSGGPAPAPVYVQPAPVYYSAPVYVQPAYAYPQPYVYPPIGLSLNLGYSRGWGGGRWR